jgi:hypothetical protein
VVVELDEREMLEPGLFEPQRLTAPTGTDLNRR